MPDYSSLLQAVGTDTEYKKDKSHHHYAGARWRVPAKRTKKAADYRTRANKGSRYV